jgi:hypothetical protein
MRVDAEEERAVYAAPLAEAADRLGDREDVPLVEGAVEGGATMPGCAEGDALRGNRRVGDLRVVPGDELRDI